MAKGWESKSVEALAGVFEVRTRTASGGNALGRNTPDSATLDRIRQKETILLSRTRILTQLKSAQNPQYRDLLNRSLADLDNKLSAL
ncbi:MAG TPA: hypothetical protein VKV17_21050 [Bryobacteraceae bacterium]|nr:hypothetical protein [Bryobacteraceae bacterium]